MGNFCFWWVTALCGKVTLRFYPTLPVISWPLFIFSTVGFHHSLALFGSVSGWASSVWNDPSVWPVNRKTNHMLCTTAVPGLWFPFLQPQGWVKFTFLQIPLVHHLFLKGRASLPHFSILCWNWKSTSGACSSGAMHSSAWFSEEFEVKGASGSCQFSLPALCAFGITFFKKRILHILVIGCNLLGGLQYAVDFVFSWQPHTFQIQCRFLLHHHPHITLCSFLEEWPPNLWALGWDYS